MSFTPLHIIRRWFATSISWTVISLEPSSVIPRTTWVWYSPPASTPGDQARNLTALAVAYQVETVLTASAPFMERGFDLTTLPGFGPIGPKADLRQMRPEMVRVT